MQPSSRENDGGARFRFREVNDGPDDPRSLGPLAALLVLGFLSLPVYWKIASLSADFAYDSEFQQRPILGFLALTGVAFTLYLAALWVAVRATWTTRLTMTAVGFAIAFRAILLFSEPIQEIDVYRYLWDGTVVAAGGDPYQYSPRQVLEVPADAAVPESLARLAAVRDGFPAKREILERIHFAELPTVYPPVSQAVFALSAWSAPSDADARTQVVAMKAWFLLFDLATLGLVFALLHWTGKPLGWSIAYGWCPLVLKEFANSGHLDAIAVCLAAAAVYLMVRSLYPTGPCKHDPASPELGVGWKRSLTASGGWLLLAL
ncbi:MAG: hypothetical protein N2C14_31630, partial [Planctomycetales bacterium]